jgi:hypothetical protein
MIKNTQAIRKMMLAARLRKSRFFILDAMKKAAQMIKSTQPKR